jgi:hypothetical protein
MRLLRDNRGFVLSGLALLIMLSVMLLIASYLKVVETGGEAAALQVVADKVTYTGKDIERAITYMSNNYLPIDNTTLQELAENYRAATGLLVDVGPVTIYPFWIHVCNTGVDRYAGTKYCKITEVGTGKWYYSFEDSDLNYNYNEPRLLVERLAGSLRITIEAFAQDENYYVDIYYSSHLIEGFVGGPWGNHVGEVLSVTENITSGIPVYVRDPSGIAQYISTVELIS